MFFSAKKGYKSLNRIDWKYKLPNQPKQVERFSEKIVTALGYDRLNSLDKQETLEMKRRMLVLISYYEGDVDKIPLTAINLEFTKAKEGYHFESSTPLDNSITLPDGF